jgi:uncharacterized protein YbjQ (UPF0145 family)
MSEATSTAEAHQPLMSEVKETSHRHINRARLIAFFERHNPGNIQHADEILEQWAGREQELFESLEDKYRARDSSGNCDTDCKYLCCVGMSEAQVRALQRVQPLKDQETPEVFTTCLTSTPGSTVEQDFGMVCCTHGMKDISPFFSGEMNIGAGAARAIALAKLRVQAAGMGANAVLGVSVAISIGGAAGGSCCWSWLSAPPAGAATCALVAVAQGTAVRLSSLPSTFGVPSSFQPALKVQPSAARHAASEQKAKGPAVTCEQPLFDPQNGAPLNEAARRVRLAAARKAAPAVAGGGGEQL